MGLSTCIVVAQSLAVREHLSALLSSKGVHALALASLRELPETLATTPACGILLELACVVTTGAEHRKATQEILEFFPSARFRFDHGQVLMVGETLDTFLERCRQVQARVTRRAVRQEAHLAVYVSADGSLADAEKSVTVNVSDTGCFVYSTRFWNLGDSVWLQFPAGEAALQGTVRNYRPWGGSKSIPGIGIELSAQQLDEHAAVRTSCNS